MIKELKEINIRENINKKECCIYHLNLNCLNELQKELKEIREDNILMQNEMTYTYKINSECIVLVLHKQLNVIA